MSFIGSQIAASRIENKLYKKSPSFLPAGQSTQLIIGATPESDLQIMKLSESLYNKFSLKRVYYSGYVPVADNPKLPALTTPTPILREHRLYQADWLLRFYGFSAKELLNENNPNFDINLDPKTDWALRHLKNFPIEVNTASTRDLLRVPGIGIRSVGKIASSRRVHSLNFDDLRALGVVLKRAKYFITCKGKYYGEVDFDEALIRKRLTDNISNKSTVVNKKANLNYEQLSFFTETPAIYNPSDAFSKITGEL
jgi:predicted DNA-binding helix-hairpin-helix protein